MSHHWLLLLEESTSSGWFACTASVRRKGWTVGTAWSVGRFRQVNIKVAKPYVTSNPHLLGGCFVSCETATIK